MNKKELAGQYQVEIKPLVVDDIDLLDPILRQHVRDRFSGEIIEKEVAAIKRYMAGGLDDEGRSRKYLVAKTSNGKVVGCMGYTTMDADMVSHFPQLEPASTVELVNAFVDSEVFRGGGVGQKLFKDTCNSAKQEGKRYLTLNSGYRYQASWGFYDKMCGPSCGLILNKFGDKADANTWMKEL